MEEQKLDVGETIYDLIAEDRDLLIYRPTLRNICKSLSSTILLAQIMHRAKQSKEGKFYKFKMPCEHIKYREGDSWCEELNFSREEFDGALKNIGIKITAKNKETIEAKEAFVWYYTDMARITWYEINTPTLKKALTKQYTLRKEANTLYEEFNKEANPLYEKCKPHSLIIQRVHTESTKEFKLFASANTRQDRVSSFSFPSSCKGNDSHISESPTHQSCKNDQEGNNLAKRQITSIAHVDKSLLKPILKKIIKSSLTPITSKTDDFSFDKFNYSPETKEILQTWISFNGKVHKQENARGVTIIQNIVDALLIPGWKHYTRLVDDPIMKVKQWSVQEIVDCITFFAGTLKKDISKMYFDQFVVHTSNNYNQTSRLVKDYSILVETFLEIDKGIIKSNTQSEKLKRELCPLIRKEHESVPEITWIKVANKLKELEIIWKVESISFYHNMLNVFIDFTKTKANNYNWKMVYIISDNHMESFVKEQIRVLTFKKRDKKVA